MRNVLVTGGAGYIGSHAAKALAQAGMQPVVFDNLVHGHKSAVRWGPLVEADLGDSEALCRTMQEFKIDAVMHFAAFAYVGESMERPGLYFQNNFVKSLVLLEAMRKTGVKDIVFSSTCATYGIPEIVPIDESAAQLPVNPYGESKLMVERALKWFGEAHGLRWTALRYFNAAGADADGEIGEAHEPETHLIPLVLDVAAGVRREITIYGADYPTPDGTCIRDYIHVTDLADAHVRAARYLAGGGASVALNLGTGNGFSVREVISAVEHVTGRAVPKRESERRQGDPASLVANPAKASSLLDWHPTRSDIETIVATAWRWHTRDLDLGHERSKTISGRS